MALLSLAKVDDAFPYIEEALAITKDRSSTDLSNPEWQMSAWYTDFFISVMQPVPPGRARAVHNAEVESHHIENQLTANASLSHSSPKVLVDLAKMQSSWGDLLRAKSKLNGAITYYKKAYKNRKLLAERDPSDIGWQSDLEVIDDKIGAVLVENNKLDDALDSYRESLKISKGLAEKDPGDTDLQRDLSMSHLNIGDVLRKQHKVDEALGSYQEALAVGKALAETDKTDAQRQANLKSGILTIGIVAYRFELAGAFADALAAADLAISFAPPGENWIQGNRAHALMFLGHVDEARTIYLQHRGERIEDRPWERALRSDFTELRNNGHKHPLMDEIEKLFAEKK